MKWQGPKNFSHHQLLPASVHTTEGGNWDSNPGILIRDVSVPRHTLTSALNTYPSKLPFRGEILFAKLNLSLLIDNIVWLMDW